MTDYLRLENGVAVELWVAPVADDIELTPSECFTPDQAAAFVLAGGGAVGMSTPDGGQTWLAPPAQANLSDLGARLVQAATAACTALTRQVVPDDTHQIAYANAATIVWGSGGNAPAADPAKTVFAGHAAAVGLTVAQLASVVQAVSLTSLELATALSTLRGAVASAKVVSDLTHALAAFEVDIAAVTTSLSGAGLTVAIAAPEPITIPGINA